MLPATRHAPTGQRHLPRCHRLSTRPIPPVNQPPPTVSPPVSTNTTLTGDSNSAVTLTPYLNATRTATTYVPTSTTEVINPPSQDTITNQPVPFKRTLKLPKSTEEWEEADRMLVAVAASVSLAVTAEEKNSCLCEGNQLWDKITTGISTNLHSY